MIRVIAIVLAAFGVFFTPAYAEHCNCTGRYDLKGDGQHPMSLAIKSGATCETTFGGGAELMTFNRLFLAVAPSRGRIKLREGGYYIYTAPATAGTDSFAVKVCGTQNNLPGCATLKYSVTVN